MTLLCPRDSVGSRWWAGPPESGRETLGGVSPCGRGVAQQQKPGGSNLVTGVRASGNLTNPFSGSVFSPVIETLQHGRGPQLPDPATSLGDSSPCGGSLTQERDRDMSHCDASVLAGIQTRAEGAGIGKNWGW